MEENLKTMMESKSINEIEQELTEFVHSGDGYENKLKLTFVLLSIIKAGTQSLQSVDVGEFITQVRDKVEETRVQASATSNEFNAHIDQNDEITGVLVGMKNNRIEKIQGDVRSLLKEYDLIIKRLVQIHDHLPIDKQLEREKEV
jgi:hypothetical protein